MKSAIILAVYVFIILSLIGWWVNVVKLFTDCDYMVPYKCEVVRITGVIIPPVGGIVGWINLGE